MPKSPYVVVNGKIKIDLYVPIVIDGKSVDTVSIRRPKMRDTVIAAKDGGTEVQQASILLANLCEIPPEAMMIMDDIDVRQVVGAKEYFLSPDSLPKIQTTPEPSPASP